MKRRRILALILMLAWAALSTAGLPAHAEEGRAYAIEVDLTNQIVTVYDAENRAVVRQMLCSTGMNDYTPTGEFSMAKTRSGSDRLPWYKIEGLFVRYASRISGEILFHSIPYMRRSIHSVNPTEAAKLGEPASHGCIRLRWQDARFIAKNCMPGTRVRIFRSGEADGDLRRMLLEASYDSGRGVSYESFLGVSAEPGALGRSDAGEEVLRLQSRLRELGFYDGEPSGVYDADTVEAVRMAQYAMKADLCGAATPEFCERLYEDDAPTGENITLTAGMSGPTVEALQADLSALRLYDGPLNGNYDGAVAEAVRRFQCAYGYEANGTASPKAQRAITYEAGRLAERFDGGEWSCQWTVDRLVRGEVAAEAGMKLRKSPTRSSGIVRELLYGDALIVLEPGKEWSRVRIDSDVGYVKNGLIRFSEQEVGCLRYSADGQSYVIGASAADYGAGAELPCDAFEARLKQAGHAPGLAELVGCVTVNTGGEAGALNLRAEPDAAGEVLDTVADGTRLRVRGRYDGWTRVRYRGRTGYLLNRYLDFWTGWEADPDVENDAVAVLTSAKVNSAVGGSAEVFAAPTETSEVLAGLAGVTVEVLTREEGWCRIRYQGKEAYMLEEDLKFDAQPGS